MAMLREGHHRLSMKVRGRKGGGRGQGRKGGGRRHGRSSLRKKTWKKGRWIRQGRKGGG